MRVLVVEDGFEYSETMGRFLSDGFDFERAGSGPQAIQRLAASPAIDVIFLDMRFDRTPENELFGDFDDLIDRFNGDPLQARRFREDHQGTYILAAIRESGHGLPVVMSYDFGGERTRFERLAVRFGPVSYLGDNAGPERVAQALRGARPS